jgi:glutamate dehydrogenase/leucine dehydrogenase
MSTVSEADARRLAEAHLRELYAPEGMEVVITAVGEVDVGWIVIYQSAQYIETGDDRYFLTGNAPLVVDRDGRVHTTGTGEPLEVYLEEIRGVAPPER